MLQIETKVGRGTEKSRSVTLGRLKTVYLLQIKTFCWNDRNIAALSPFALTSLSSLR